MAPGAGPGPVPGQKTGMSPPGMAPPQQQQQPQGGAAPGYFNAGAYGAGGMPMGPFMGGGGGMGGMPYYTQ